MIDFLSRMRARPARPNHPLTRLLLALAAAGLLAGCGSSTASSTSSTSAASSATATSASGGRPAYCSAVNSFKSAVAHVKDTGSVSGIVSSLTTVETTGQAAIVAVKTAFVSATGALKSSLATLANSVKQLLGSSTRSSALQALPGQVAAVKTTADAFITAAKTGCG